jgi:hypothetical protein
MQRWVNLTRKSTPRLLHGANRVRFPALHRIWGGAMGGAGAAWFDGELAAALRAAFGISGSVSPHPSWFADHGDVR